MLWKNQAFFTLQALFNFFFMAKNSDDKFVHHFFILYYISMHFSQNIKLCFFNDKFDKYWGNFIMYRLSLPKILEIADNKVL